MIIELDDKLESDEFFTGISAVNNEGQTVFVGMVEKLDKMLRPLSKRYVNIKAKYLKPKNDTFTKEDLKAAFLVAPKYENDKGVIENFKSFEDWFKFNYEDKQ